MAAVLKHWREAATLILVSSSKAPKNVNFQLVSSIVTPKNILCEDYEILLLKRSNKSKFMPNLYVFPGGVADDSDFSKGWLDIFSQLGHHNQSHLFKRLTEGSSQAAPMFTRHRDPAFSSVPPEIAFRLCAIRETFEESGVLVALSFDKSKEIVKSILSSDTDNSLNNNLLVKNSQQVQDWRVKINKNPAEFFNMCQELQLIPAIWSLYEWSNWLTPVTAAENNRRFDTAFYICCVHEKPEAAEDAGETIGAQWASPSVILTEYMKKGAGIAPPQYYEITRLLNFQTSFELYQHISNPDRDRMERWLPILVACVDYAVSLMPGDDLYPKEPDLYHNTQFHYFHETGENLMKMYPNTHRTIFFRGKSISAFNATIQCNIPPRRKGHVVPRINILELLKQKAKL